MRISVIQEGELWARAVAMVKQKYLDRHAASIEPAPGYFVVVQDLGGRLLACTGLTFADTGPLFSECYLDLPVEQAASAHFRRDYRRGEIVEVGSLAAADPGAARLLMRMMPILANQLGARLVLCTVTPRVRALLGACRLAFLPLCVADGGRVEKPQDWGRYYQEAPQTGFIDLEAPAAQAVDSALYRSERQAV